jgi:hypothetical protein
VAQSSTEAKFMTSAAASKEVLWHRKLRRDFKLPAEDTTQVWGDNQAAL